MMKRTCSIFLTLSLCVSMFVLPACSREPKAYSVQQGSTTVDVTENPADGTKSYMVSWTVSDTPCRGGFVLDTREDTVTTRIYREETLVYESTVPDPAEQAETGAETAAEDYTHICADTWFGYRAASRQEADGVAWEVTNPRADIAPSTKTFISTHVSDTARRSAMSYMEEVSEMDVAEVAAQLDETATAVLRTLSADPSGTAQNGTSELAAALTVALALTNDQFSKIVDAIGHATMADLYYLDIMVEE